MPDRIEFETPENVQVSYELAGLGTRFLAWLYDFIILGLFVFVLFIVLLIVSTVAQSALEDWTKSFSRIKPGAQPEIPLFILAFFVVVFGFASLLYFGLSELLMRGQTWGKRSMKLRVVKADGFSLDLGSIFIRNVFRVIDHLPLLWIVLLLAKRSQRLGDMVAGTIVIRDQDVSQTVSPLRERLLKRPAEDAQFHFSIPALQKLRASDFEAVEKFLERQAALKPADRDKLLTALCMPLAQRAEMEPPDALQRLRFLEDLLSAEYRRQYRALG